MLGPYVPWAVGARRCARAAAKPAIMAPLWLRCDRTSSSCITSMRYDLFMKSLSAKMSSSNPPWTLTAPTVTRLAIVVDSNGLASLWDVFCRTPVPQFLVLFLRNMYLMPWRLRIRRCRYSMSAFAIFGDLWTASVAGMLYGTTIQMLLSLLQALANSALDCHSPGQQFFV